MGNAAIVITNLCDGGSVAASSQALVMPAVNLLSPHVTERWRSLTNDSYFVLDHGALVAGDTVVIPGLTAGSNATMRLRLSSTDASGAAGDVYDSGAVAAGASRFNVNLGVFAAILSSPVSWRYLRADIADPDQSYVEAGLVFAGLRYRFSINFDMGMTLQWVDRSRVTVSEGGLTLTWRDNKFRRYLLPFSNITSAERYGVIDQLDRVNGLTDNIVLITDTATDQPGRDCAVGLVTELAAVTLTTPDLAWFGKQFKFDERL